MLTDRDRRSRRRRWMKRWRRVTGARSSTWLLVAGCVTVVVFAGFVVRGDREVDASVDAPPLEPPPSETIPPAASLDDVRAVLASPEPLVVSVIGDSTGNGPGEWVDLWAQRLGETRRVELHLLQPDRPRWGRVLKYGDTGPRLVIWNFSLPGARADFAQDHLDVAQPVEPDLAIYNAGHNGTVGTVPRELGGTMDAFDEKWGHPILNVMVLQNPSLGPTRENQRETVAYLRSTIAPKWGVPTIDVWGAFPTVPERLRSLLWDNVHPNDEGAVVWARAVTKALG